MKPLLPFFLLLFILFSGAFAQSNNYVRLKYKNIKKLPDSLLSYKSIDSLDLSINLLRKIDFEKIPSNIHYLDLGYNPLKKIDGICRLTQLNELCLMHTYVKELPDCICEMPNLEILQLVNIRLEKLPECLMNNKTLRLVILSGNTPPFTEDYKKKLINSMPNCKFVFN
jgi:Leucine-rich repeat (LRR) protein